jgi:hypothetical protein
MNKASSRVSLLILTILFVSLQSYAKSEDNMKCSHARQVKDLLGKRKIKSMYC